MEKETDIIFSLFFRDLLNFFIHDFIFDFLVSMNQSTLIVSVLVMAS